MGFPPLFTESTPKFERKKIVAKFKKLTNILLNKYIQNHERH